MNADLPAALPLDRRARDVSLGALAHARELGVTISVVVVDASGALVSALRMDGADWFTPDVARAKARTAVPLRADTADLAALRAQEPDLFALIAEQLAFLPTTLPGGLVLREADGTGAEVIVAGVGVSGATAEQDLACARSGAAAFG